jgi:hypothetical protein
MPNFDKILKENINHNLILDREGVIKAMTECYKLGFEHSVINFEKLKTSFEYVLEQYVPDVHQNSLKINAGLIEMHK